MTDQLIRRNAYPRYACLLMIAAIGVRGIYTALLESNPFQALHTHWALQWFAGYLIFAAAYAVASQRESVEGRSTAQLSLIAVQCLMAVYLIWLYPSFLVTCLLVVVAWQIGWSTSLRTALLVALIQAVALASIKCIDPSQNLSILILLIACAFQVFAITAAHLARSEAQARDELLRVNGELRATQVLMAESARMSERLRISRDLHDIMGHNLTSLAIHLEVASRLAQGQAAEHVQCARDVASALLTEVRAVVNRVRVEPVDLSAALRALTDSVVGLNVRLVLPDELAPVDAARADAVIRCVQEVLTNALRHAQAKELAIELRQARDGCISIDARDNGQGGSIVEGSGLTGMRERFRLLGGELSIASSPGAGFSIHGAIPATGGHS